MASIRRSRPRTKTPHNPSSGYRATGSRAEAANTEKRGAQASEMEMKFADTLVELQACRDARVWAGDKTLSQAWKDCERGDWLLWLAAEAGVDRRLIVEAACRCAEAVIGLLPEGEERPLRAIETARAWIRGEATLEEVWRASRAADAAADAAYAAYAAYAVAYAADAAAAYAADAAAADAYAAGRSRAKARSLEFEKIADKLVELLASAPQGKAS